jgi:hypothetical protein
LILSVFGRKIRAIWFLKEKSLPKRKLTTIFGSLLLTVLLTTQCTKQLSDVYVPVGTTAKVNREGELFALKPGEIPFGDSAVSIDLWTTSKGVRDLEAMQSLDVLEHNDKEIATKVRIRGGQYVGREVWTHPKYVSKLDN